MRVKLEPLPMREAQAFWRDKVQMSPSEFKKLSDEARLRAFAVSGIAKGAELDSVFQALQRAIDKGTTFDEFKAECASIFEKRGWTGRRAWRVDNIFRTNIQTAYNVGHYKQLAGDRDVLPYWQYSAINDSRTRPTHLAMDGRVWPADHPVWATWFPPNGYRCRCSVIGLTRGQVKARGLTVEEKDPTGRLIEPIDPKSGNRMPARQLLPDPGFAVNPGKSYWGGLHDIFDGAIPRMSAVSGAVTMEEMGAVARKIIGENYKEWLDKAGERRREYVMLGSLSPVDVRFLMDKGVIPSSSAIVINDRLVSGKKAERHSRAGNALTREEWENLPMMVASPETVLYDTEDGKILYVAGALTDDRKIKVVVEIGVVTKKLDAVVNETVTVFKIGGNALQDRRRYEKIR